MICQRKGCNNEVVPPRVSYCSEYCKDRARNERRREESTKKRKEQFASQGMLYFTCPYCGKTVERKSSNQKTCGDKVCRRKHDVAARRVENSLILPDLDNPEISNEELLKKLREAERIRAERVKLAKHFQEIGKTEYLIEKLRMSQEVAKPLNPKPLPDIKNHRFRDEEAVLLLSDAQVGEEVEFEDVGGLNEYNFATFEKYINNIRESLWEIIDIHRRAYRVDTLNIFLLGDIIANVLMFQGQHNWNELDLYEQLFEGKRILTELIVALASGFKQLNVYGVPGNHGRIEAKKGTQKAYVNYDYFIYKMIEQSLSAHKNVACHFPKSFFQIVEVQGKKFFICHGDNIQQYLQMPWYGIERAAKEYHALMSKHGQIFDYFVVAHFHTQSEVEVSFGEILVNGHFVGPNQFSIEKLKKGNMPRQMFFGVNAKRGITWRYWLDLAV